VKKNLHGCGLNKCAVIKPLKRKRKKQMSNSTKHKSLPDVRSHARGGDANTKPRQENNNQQKQEMISAEEHGLAGAGTSNKAQSETTPVKNAVPEEIQQSADLEVKPQDAGQAGHGQTEALKAAAASDNGAKPASSKNSAATPPLPLPKRVPLPQAALSKKSKDTVPGEVNLTPSQKLQMSTELRKREKIIRQGQETWRAGATALMEIRDLRLYRAQGYTDFGKYAKEELHMGKSTITRQIAIGEVYKAMAPMGAKILPTSERQMRPLLKLRKPNQKPCVWGATVAKVWEKAVKDAAVLKTPVTPKCVLRALQELGLEEAKPSKEAPLEFNAQKRWTDLLGYLEHEREFWPREHRRYLSEHIAALVRHWESGMNHLVFAPDHPKSMITEDWDKPLASEPPKPLPEEAVR